MSGIAAAIFMYWLQVYAYYEPAAFTPGEEIRLTPLGSDTPEVIVVDNITGIDAESSPLRFRACFTTPLSQAMLTETYRVYDDPTPLIGPGWFDCYDVGAIDEGLHTGAAIAFLSEKNIHPGVDRVVAVFGDGRAYAWHQMNETAEQTNGFQ